MCETGNRADVESRSHFAESTSIRSTTEGSAASGASNANLAIPDPYDTTTSGGVDIETLGGQQIGASQTAFQAAVGEFMVLYETDTVLGFDIVNPEAEPYSRIGAYAEFAGGELDYLAAPNILGFVGSCA